MLATLITGCGFQLRGYGEQPIGLKAVALKFGPELTASSWSYALRRQLSQAGIALAEDAPTQLTLTDISLDKDIVSYDSRGKAAEYQLSQSVSIKIETLPTGDDTSTTNSYEDTLNGSRVYTFDPENVSGKSQEERLLTREIQTELIRDIVLRLSDYSRSQAIGRSPTTEALMP
jgi:LPS-assembly lipoprotein